MTMVNAFDPGDGAGLGEAERAMIARRDQLLGAAYRLFYARPVHPLRGEGVWLYEADGSRLLDAYNNVVSVGHCHPHVVEAICTQAGRLNTHTRYLDETILAYSERLLATLPAGFRAMFACTGSEANDLALRIARFSTGRQGVIVTANAYHGVTEASAELSPSLGARIAPGPRVRAVAAPADPARFVETVRAAIADLDRAGLGCAAMIVDTLMSSDGLIPDAGEALRGAAEAVREAGGLLIADEVQAGFGRTGRMWGFDRHALRPDIVTMGKPMGNGHPIAAAVMRADLAASFGESVRYFNTFGGNPVSCAAAAAVLDVIEGESLLGNAERVGSLLADGLRAIADRSGAIGGVRAAGLFAAADIVDAAGAPDGARAGILVNAMRERGALISATGPHGHTLKIRPPLVFQAEHAELLLEALSDALEN
jgi:4-aminobutyrate aminotransferase-like enzyme